MSDAMLQPRFIEGKRGALFALHHAPKTIAQPASCVLVVPSFAEEMNRCRYMQTLLAHKLTAAGVGMLIVDPYGAGDSAGEFEDSSWDQWIDDTVTAIGYARELGYARLSLLGIRLGALLAQAAAVLSPVEHMVFWQPVVSGKVTMNQFLRLKVAASIGRDEEATSTAALEKELADGNSIQVAGYDVSPGLFDGIKNAHLNQHVNELNLPVDWFTVLASEERKTPRGDRSAIEKWNGAGARVRHHEVIGLSFWQAHERTLAPALVEATADIFTSGSFAV